MCKYWLLIIIVSLADHISLADHSSWTSKPDSGCCTKDHTLSDCKQPTLCIKENVGSLHQCYRENNETCFTTNNTYMQCKEQIPTFGRWGKKKYCNHDSVYCQTTSVNASQYINVSLVFLKPSDVVSVRIGSKGSSNSCLIKRKNEFYKNRKFPLLLKIAFLPYISNPTGVEFMDGHVCERNETKERCSKLDNNVTFTLKSISTKALSLTMVNGEDVAFTNLQVDLLSSSCKNDCSVGIVENCQRLQVQHYVWSNTSEELLMNSTTSFQYYCTRIYDEEHCCGTKGTSVIHLPGKEGFVERVPVPTDGGLFALYVAITVFTLFISFIVYIYISLIKRQGNMRAIVKENNSVESCSNHKNRLIDIDLKIAYENFQVLLLYPKEDEIFQKLVDTFRLLLENYAIKVLDPNDEEYIEEINTNWWQWLETVLKIPKLKIIVIETDEYKQWVSNDFDKNQISIFTHGLFYYALARIKEDQILCRDYSRLFRISFDTKPCESVTIIVPLTHYQMPLHLPQLICDLTGTSLTLDKENDDDIKRKELFMKLINDFGQQVEE